jgi:hypothetical protein
MQKELESQLVKKYPKIFEMVGSSPQESCMAWGLAVGDGWYWLIDNLCSHLQGIIDNNEDVQQVVAAQVKEKFGGLRFYINSGSDEQYGAIGLAEHMSYSICEDCGTTKDVTTEGPGWIRTLCQECQSLSQERMDERLKDFRKSMDGEE